MSRYLLVANPAAQSGKNAERIALARHHLEDAGRAVELFPTRAHGETIPRLTEHLSVMQGESSYSAIVAMGGDGTFREVCAALMALAPDVRPPVGMLPTGTANDQGKSFGLSATAKALARNIGVILQGHETLLDAGMVHVHACEGAASRTDYFFDSLGFGLTARVLHVRNKDRDLIAGLGPLRALYRDHAVYAGAFVKTFLESYIESDKFTADVVIDGQRSQYCGLTDLVVRRIMGTRSTQRARRRNIRAMPVCGQARLGDKGCDQRGWISHRCRRHNASWNRALAQCSGAKLPHRCDSRGRGPCVYATRWGRVRRGDALRHRSP
jgi:diacylglycerol kinase family enzyme